MRDDDISGAIHENGIVKIHWRQWDGVDRPEHYYSGGINSNRARSLAQSLMKAADEADEFVNEKKNAQLIDLERQYETLGNQIQRLKNDLAR